MDDGNNTELFPYLLEATQGETYIWCGSNCSSTPPLCDKRCAGDKSVVFEAQLTEDVYLCQCTRTKNPPWCDGSHAKLLLERVNSRTNK